MAATHGKNSYFAVDDSGNTLRDLSTYLKSGSGDQTTETVDVSVWGDDSKKYIQGLNDGQFQLEGVWDSTVDGYLHGIKGAGEKDFEYGPIGDTGSNVKYSGKVLLTSYNISNDIGSEVRFSATLQVSGDVTRGTF
jgi:hypothetical protein